MPDLHARLSFFLATDTLKTISRANWIYSEARLETVAEHNWHTLLLAMLFADAAPDGVDHNRVRDLLIVHDLVEVYAGDTPIWDDAARTTETNREWVAGERLMALLPHDMFDTFDSLWREYQAQGTAEALFARAIDALHPIIMAWAEGAHGHENTTITLSRLLERKRAAIEDYPDLWVLVLQILQVAVDRGMLPPDEVPQRSEEVDHA